MKTKKIIAGLLATAMVITGISIAPKKAEAAVATDVIYEYFTDYSTYLDFNKAPVFDAEGEYVIDGDLLFENEPVEVTGTEEYLFGGWYGLDSDYNIVAIGQNSDGKYTVNKELVDLENDIIQYTGNGDGLFAKWVPASILSVKAQNNHDAKTAGATNTRLLSSVDSLDYQTVGFKVQLKNDPNKDLGVMETTKVYESLSYKKEDGSEHSVPASSVFEAEAEFFVVWVLEDIKSEHYNEIIYVKPYWVTADGVTVYGLPKYVHVVDGINKYISVPVNLTDISEDNAVAAGVFEISYDSSKLKLATIDNGKAVETGRVFEELEYADKDGKIKFAANVSNINTNAKENDIYVNLRFELVSGDIAHTSYDFEITEQSEDFCDNEENKKTINIWDVLY